MQKNVLKESINKLGIYEGDVIKITNECGIDYYQYDGWEFIYLCATEEDSVMGEDEIYDLIAGNINFEIIARGENRQLDIEESVEDIKAIIDVTRCQVNDLSKNVNDYIQKEKEKEEKFKKVDSAINIICIASCIFALIYLLLIR